MNPSFLKMMQHVREFEALRDSEIRVDVSSFEIVKLNIADSLLDLLGVKRHGVPFRPMQLAGFEPPPKPERKPTGHKEFTDAWCSAYPCFHNGQKYFFQGAKDGAASARLLKSTGMTPSQLMAIASDAWRHPEIFNCKQAATIAGFASRFNDIRAELARSRAQEPMDISTDAQGRPDF